MSGWAPRPFWKTVAARAEGGGWIVALDDRTVMTPVKQPMRMPTRAMADAAAEEWAAQVDKIDPSTMPVTRAANAAIDKVTRQQDEVVTALAAYGETDLLCHRAEGPEALAERQRLAWDPLLDWAAERFGARLIPSVGVMPQEQEADALNRLTAELARHDSFSLTALHDLIMLSGSLVLGLAVFHGRLSGVEAWEISRVDENWQIEQWGRDAEAEEADAVRRDAFLAAERLVVLLGVRDRKI